MEYYIVINNDKKGPFSLEELKKQNPTEDSLIWYKGLSDWTEASKLKELDDFFESLPPPIPKIHKSSFFNKPVKEIEQQDIYDPDYKKKSQTL